MLIAYDATGATIRKGLTRIARPERQGAVGLAITRRGMASQSILVPAKAKSEQASSQEAGVVSPIPSYTERVWRHHLEADAQQFSQPLSTGSLKTRH